MKCFIVVLYKKLSSKNEFLSNGLINTLTLLEGVNEFLPVLVRFGRNSI